MSAGPGHALAYPVSVTIGAVAVCAAAAPFADVDQFAALIVVVLAVLGYSGVRLATALGRLPNGLDGTRVAPVRRVRHQHRLVSRSWLEIGGPGPARWLPVYFDPALLALVESEAEVGARVVRVAGVRLYPSGRARASEPRGTLVDNPSRPDPESEVRAVTVTRPLRRLLLDAQSAVSAPFAGLLWVYVMDGGPAAFAGATAVAAVLAVWLAAIRGSDPS